MQKLNKYFWLLSLFLCFTAGLSAQNKDQFLKAAEEYYEFGDYANAAFLFGEALEFDTTDHQVRFRRGESNLLYRAYKRAIADFEVIEAANAAGSFTRLPYLMGKAQQPLGRYDQAIDNFARFLANPGNTSAQEIEDAERQRENSSWAKEVVMANEVARENGRAPAIAPIHYGEVNTRFDDFAPYFQENEFYFSSLRFRMEKDSIKPGRKIAKILKRNATSDAALNEKLPENINQENRTAAHTAFNSAGTIAYFTYCEYLTDTLHQRCDIFMAPVSGDGKWGAPSRLNINAAGANTTSPNVGLHPDGTEYLYFASDRSGGQGMHDLYRAPLGDDGTPGMVEALDDINTAFDDVTPFYYAPKRELYFSTDGRNTLGGLDVYRSGMLDDGWADPVHLGIPTNSSYNDVYYGRFEKSEEAYFASNRHSAEAIFWDEDEEVCCNDIYKVEIPTICLEVTTFHAITKADLNGTTVIFYEELANGDRIELAKETHEDNNLYTFEMELGRKYGVMAKKRGFKGDEAIIDVSLPDVVLPADGSCIEQPLYLPPPTIRLEVVTLNKSDRTDLNGCTVDLMKGVGTLLSLLSTETKAESNFYSYDIQLENYYEIHGSKENYTSDSAFVNTRGLFILNDTVIKRELLLEPDLPCELEPTVYFHNDRPVKGTPHTITPANYGDTYTRYINTYKPAYYSKWVAAGNETAAEMDAFFTVVDQGATDLDEFATMLERYLAGEGKIAVTLQGFASPLSNGPYNKKLSSRRCISVINYLENHNGGVLRSYLDKSVIMMFQGQGYSVPGSYDGIPIQSYTSAEAPVPEGKQLVFIIKPNGETASTGAAATGPASVYSTAAGRARYVEVKVAGCPTTSTSNQ